MVFNSAAFIVHGQSSVAFLTRLTNEKISSVAFGMPLVNLLSQRKKRKERVAMLSGGIKNPFHTETCHLKFSHSSQVLTPNHLIVHKIYTFTTH